jgi:site-specific recombinase XerD
MNKSNGSRRTGAAPTDKSPEDRLRAPLIQCAFLQTYIAGIRKDWPDAGRDRHLFLNRFGQGMGPNAVWHVVHEYARAANIDRAVSMHTFHNCATHMRRAGAPIRHLQEMLGHASIETTQIYMRVTTTDLKAVHRRFHPREQRAAKLPRRTTRRIISLGK